jgi:hypothetical protein
MFKIFKNQEQASQLDKLWLCRLKKWMIFLPVHWPYMDPLGRHLWFNPRESQSSKEIHYQNPMFLTQSHCKHLHFD